MVDSWDRVWLTLKSITGPLTGLGRVVSVMDSGVGVVLNM